MSGIGPEAIAYYGMPPAPTISWPVFALEILKLTQDLIKTLAWPGLLMVLIALFRHEIRRVLPAIRNFKYPGGEINFGDEIHLLRREDAPASAASRASGSPESARRPHGPGASTRRFRRAQLEKLARIDPRSAVMEAWSRLSSEAMDCILRNTEPPRPDELEGPGALARALETRGILVDDDAARFRRLARLRNIAKHAPEHAPTPEHARDFARVAGNLVGRLKA